MCAELAETNLPVELWDGEIIMSPSPKPTHQTLVLALARRLAEFVQSHSLGLAFVAPLDVVLTPRRVVQPDVFFIAAERAEFDTETRLGTFYQASGVAFVQPPVGSVGAPARYRFG